MAKQTGAKFKDSTGHQWDIKVDLPALRRIKASGVDLLGPDLPALFLDDIFLADLLCIVLKPELESQGLSQEQFEARLSDGMCDARRAFIDSYVRYLGLKRGNYVLEAEKAIDAEISSLSEKVKEQVLLEQSGKTNG